MSEINPVQGNLTTPVLDSPLFVSVFRVNKSETLQSVLQGAQAAASSATQALPQLPPDKAVILGNSRFSFSSNDILFLIRKINPDGVTYQQIRTFSDAKLTPQQQKIRAFLEKNPQVFKQFAALDKKANTLSQLDIQIAASLAGDIKTLSNEDLAKVQVVFSSQDSFAKTRASAPIETRTQASPAFSGLGQNAITPPLETRATPPLDPRFGVNPRNTAAADEANRVKNRPTQPVTDLSKNELIKAAVSTQFAAQTSLGGLEPFENETTTEDRMRVNPIRSNDDMRAILRTRQKIELHAPDLMQVFANINHGAPITLGQLRIYRPKNKQEERVLSVVKRLKVFEELSQMDGEESTLALEDIKIATDGHSFVLSDPHMYLVILPD